MPKIKMVVVTKAGREFEVVLPARRALCYRCDGTGGHDPEGFSGGFTSSEFAEMCAGDDEFEERYFSGRYDVPCTVCHGQKVILEIDYDALHPRMRQRIEHQERLEAEFEAERAAERRYGA